MENIYSEIDLFLGEIDKYENIALAGHISPDGDAISSCIALALALRKKGKMPTIILEKYEGYEYLEGSNMVCNILSYEKPFDMFIALDCGDKKRLPTQILPLFEGAKKTINIDHHITNNGFSNINIVNDKASSTCEIVYEIVEKMDVLDKDIATALYTGIVFDTSGFKHKSATKRTYEVASKLIEKGVDNSFIHSRLLYTHTFENARLLAMSIQNLERRENIIATSLSKDDIIKKCSASYMHLEGISGYMLDFADIDVAVFLYEKDDGSIKVSFRANDLNVNEIAKKYGGGGHMLASGATLYMPLDEAKALMLDEVQKSLKK